MSASCLGYLFCQFPTHIIGLHKNIEFSVFLILIYRGSLCTLDTSPFSFMSHKTSFHFLK